MYFGRRAAKYKKISNQFQKEYGREPSEEEYKEFLDVDDIKFHNIQRAAYLRDTHSLNVSMILEDESFELENLIPAEVDVESDVMHKLNHGKMSNKLWTVIGQLPERKAEVMKKRYQIGLSKKDTGDLFEMTDKQVTRIEADVRLKIRSDSEGKLLREYYMQYV